MTENRYTPIYAGHAWRDERTGLEWAETTPTRYTWDEAIEAAESCCLGSHEDWRLPSIEELVAVVDYQLAKPATGLPDTRSDFYWSSTTYQSFPSSAWFVDFDDGYSDADTKSSGNSVRAVRGGPVAVAARAGG